MKAKLQKKRNQIRGLCTSLLNQKAEGLIQYEIKEYMPSCSNPDIYPKTNIV